MMNQLEVVETDNAVTGCMAYRLNGMPTLQYIEPYFQGRRCEPIEHAGMSLRDYFAAKAMQGELSSKNPEESWPEKHADSLARKCYYIADAMLEAREK
jgi:hypothetical protein